MAGLSPGRGTGSASDPHPPGADRAQVFLVVAVAMAALLVVLAVVLNAALYAGNATARDDGVDDTSALGYRNGVVAGGAPVVTYANRNNNSSYTELESTTRAGIGAWSDLAGRHAATGATGANVSFESTSDGVLVDQLDATRAYTNVSGTASWELLGSTANVRTFGLNVSRSALVDPSPSEESSANALESAGVFAITLDNGSDVWQVFVYANGTDVSVKVDDPVSGLSDPCRAPEGANGYVNVDLSNATVGGQDCPQLDVLDDPDGSFDLAYERGANATGTYSLVADREFAFVDDGDFGTTGGPPRVSHALYSITVRLRYVTPSLRYETTVEIVPGERHG